MYKTISILKELEKYPVFDTTAIASKLDKSSEYTNLFLHRLKTKGRILRIERNKYTLFSDAFLIASRIIWPAYISGWSALNFHHLTEQIPHKILVITPKYKKPISFNSTEIIFTKIDKKHFFGYDKLLYNNFEIFIANKEKAIIDSALLKKVSFSEISSIFLDNINEINIGKLIRYLKKTNNKSLIKRFGFLLDSAGKDRYKSLKRFIDATYVPLDYSKEKYGKKNTKWKVIENH